MMTLTKWKTIFLLIYCILALHLLATSSREQKPSDFTGIFEASSRAWSEKCLGYKKIQKQINERVTGSQLFDGKDIFSKLASDVRKRISDRIEALEELMNAVDGDETLEGEQFQCCSFNASSMNYNPRFKTKVDPDLSCQLRAKQSHRHAKGLDGKVIRAMYKNFKKNPLLKWQYFGSADGVTTVFPATPLLNCGNYDNRVRPWYVNTVSPVRKNVVVVMDTSTSMASPVFMETEMTTVLDVAKAAVNDLFDSLFEQDMVTVVLFNTKVALAPSAQNDSCFSEVLSHATPFNIIHLKNFVSDAKPGGGTLYNRGLKAAFKILRDSRVTGITDQQSAILFITDGPPNDVKASVVKTVQDIKSILHVPILTYGIGSNLKMKEFLARLAKEAATIEIPVENVFDLPHLLVSYYKHLPITHDHPSHTVSPPYMDEWGLGLIITISMPCYRDKQFQGVAAIDIPLPDLLSNIQYFTQAGPDSFMFMASKDGRVLYHPLLSPPETIIKDPGFVHIMALGEGFNVVFEEDQGLIQESSVPGQRRPIPHGGTSEEGVHEVIVNTKYYCSVVYSFVVCLAQAQDNVDAKILDDKDKDVVYHRMDLVSQGILCYNFDAVSYTDRSVVQFSTRAFRRPLDQLDFNESLDNVHRLLDFINYDLGDPTIFQSDIVETARMTSFLDKLWIGNVPNDCKTHVPRKYFGTYNGVLRFFPGEPLPKNYDHTNRPWYLKAKAHPDQLMFTTPYRDPLGSGIIVTVSHAITMVTKEANEKTVFGVAAADWTLPYLDIHVRNELGLPCKNTKTTTCFLIDTAGYIVFHPRFVQRNFYGDVTMVKRIHITKMHGHIASVLIDNGIMTKRKCRNVEDNKIQIYYKIKLREEGIIRTDPTKPGRCDKFAFKRLDKTNLFVVAAFYYDTKSKCDVSESCPCGPTCTKASQEYVCECPCTYKRLDFSYCRDSFDMPTETTIPACSSTSPQVQSLPSLSTNATELPKCFEPKCEEQNSEGSCAKTFGCAWCRWKDEKDLETPFCAYDNECYGGVKGKTNPFLRPNLWQNTNHNSIEDVDQEGMISLITKQTTIIGISMASIVTISTVLICVSLCCFQRKKNDKECTQQIYQHETPDGFILPQIHAVLTMPDGYQETSPELDLVGVHQNSDDAQQKFKDKEQPIPENEIFDDF